MKEISSITAGFVDHEGLYYALSERLARDYGRVLYTDGGEEAFDTINRAIIGDSYPENERLERVDDILLRKDEVDLWVFPDSKSAGLQLMLEEQGKPVWGSRRGNMLEHSREAFVDILKKLGLQVPKFQRVVGITNLRAYLKDKEDQIIKISKYRGTMETKKWRSWDEDEHWLDYMAVRFGGVKDIWPFLVFESIDTDIEIGVDTYCINGKFPSVVIGGTETKDRAYLGELKPRDEIPGESQAVLELFAPVLAYFNMRNFWSMEIRVKGDEFYFVDPTPRAPLPASASQMELYENLAEIIAAGATGELIEPKPSARFAAECAITMKCEKGRWPSIRIPAELKRWVKLSACCSINDRHWFPPMPEDHGEEVGWLVALGNSPVEAIETLKGYTEALPDGVEAGVESLAQTIKDIESANEQGVTFTDEPLPEPHEVVSD